MNTMRFFVFSYNRGQFLANCLRSLEEAAPDSPVTVFDDRSNDPETRAVLERASARHTVVRCGEDSGHKLGGLYSNMQAALESAGEHELLCFTQDDTQLVRPLEEADYRAIDDSFARRPDLAFLSPAFVRGISLQGKRGLAFDYDEALGLFFARPSRRSAGVYYSDIFITRTDRLREAGWRFERGEPANAARAAADFGPMGYLRSPFLMWLPNGTAYRGKTKTLALRWAERTRRCGFYPFEPLQPQALERLRHAQPARLPVAEEFLRTVPGDLPEPWIYDPLQGARLLKHANRIELLLRKHLRRR